MKVELCWSYLLLFFEERMYFLRAKFERKNISNFYIDHSAVLCSKFLTIDFIKVWGTWSERVKMSEREPLVWKKERERERKDWLQMQMNGGNLLSVLSFDRATAPALDCQNNNFTYKNLWDKLSFCIVGTYCVLMLIGKKTFYSNCIFKYFLKKWANPGLFFVYFRSFQTQYYRKTIDFSGIRTRIVGKEDEHADHLATTTAHI